MFSVAAVLESDQDCDGWSEITRRTSDATEPDGFGTRAAGADLQRSCQLADEVGRESNSRLSRMVLSSP